MSGGNNRGQVGGQDQGREIFLSGGEGRCQGARVALYNGGGCCLPDKSPTCSGSRRLWDRDRRGTRPAPSSAPLEELHEGYAPHLTCSRSRRAVCSAPLAVMSFSGPMKQRREVTTASRRGSMAGLVTWGGGQDWSLGGGREAGAKG